MVETEYKIGERVEVVGRTEGHCFWVGAIVTIKSMRPEMDFYNCTDGVNEWAMSSAEFDKLDE